MKYEIEFIPHKNSEKKHSRRFTPTEENEILKDLYFLRPAINDKSKVKVTIELKD